MFKVTRTETERCTGHCCEDFTLPIPPMQVDFENKKLAMGKRPRFGIEGDWAKVGAMLIFKRLDKQQPAGWKVPRGEKTSYAFHYTCKHYDREKRECSVYEERPQMCRDYPNVEPCKYKKCTRVVEKRDELVQLSRLEKEDCERLRVMTEKAKNDLEAKYHDGTK